MGRKILGTPLAEGAHPPGNWRWVNHGKYGRHIKVTPEGLFRLIYKTRKGDGKLWQRMLTPEPGLYLGEPAMVLNIRMPHLFVASAAELVLQTWEPCKNTRRSIQYLDGNWQNIQLDNLHWCLPSNDKETNDRLFHQRQTQERQYYRKLAGLYGPI